MKDTKITARLEKAAGQGTMIMAHRGVCGANILDNTIESFELALKQGADILEADRGHDVPADQTAEAAEQKRITGGPWDPYPG